MLISYRHSPFLDSLSPLYLLGASIQLVLEFKYLEVTLLSSLSWSKHISLVYSKSCHLLGLLYHQFYHHSDSQTLLQLYTSLIRPHLDYSSFIWDPHSPLPQQHTVARLFTTVSETEDKLDADSNS